MDAVIIFDVTLGQELNVVKSMRLMGYNTFWESAGQKYNLPRNVVWKPNTEVEDAKTDLLSAIEQMNSFRYSNKIKLLRCIVLDTHSWAGITGDYASYAGA